MKAPSWTSLCDQGTWRVGSLTAATERTRDRTHRCAGCLVLWGLAMALEAAGILLWLANHAILVDRFGTAEDTVPHVFLVPGYATVGAVIAARSRNRIGWLFLAFGLAAALLTFANPYYLRGTVIAPGSLPAAAAILGSWASVLWPSTYLFLGLLLLLFPDGRLPSPRWRPVALVYVTSWVLLMLDAVVAPATGPARRQPHQPPGDPGA